MSRRKIKRIIRWTLISLLLLPLLLIFLSQLRPIQRAIANKATSWLAETLETEVKLDDISWRGLNYLEINGFLIRDHQEDTLIAARKLSIRFDFRKLFRKEYHLDEVTLSGAIVRLAHDQDSTWNFDFITQAFASAPDTSQSNLQIQLLPNLIILEDIRFDYSDAISGSELHASLDYSELKVARLDLNQQEIDIRSFLLDQPEISYVTSASEPLPSDTIPAPYTFPDLGWYIQIDQMVLDSGIVSYLGTQKEHNPEGTFDPGDVLVRHLSWDIRELRNTDSTLAASIRSMSFSEKSGLELSEFQTDVLFTATRTSLQDFRLKTPHSWFDQSILLTYPDLNVLKIFSEPNSGYDPDDITLDALFDQVVLSPEDLRLFSSGYLPPELDQPLFFSGSANGTLANIKFEERLSLPAIDLKLHSQGILQNPLNVDQLYLDLQVDTLLADYAKLDMVLPEGTLPIQFQSWGSIDLQGQIRGRISDFEATDFQLFTSNGPQLKADFQIIGLPEYSTATYHLQLDQLQSKPEDWVALLPDTLPTVLANVDQIVLNGTFDGTIYTFQTRLNLETEDGLLVANTNIDFEEDYSNARYSGQVRLKDFDLGAFLQDTSLGIINLNLNLDGQGLQPADLNTKVEGTLSDLMYNQYEYDSLYVNGQVDSSVFVGIIRMNDPNLNFALNGRIPYRDSMSAYQFSLQLDTVNFKPLGFYDRQIGMRSMLDLDLRNLDIDELEGNLELRDLVVEDSLNRFYADTIRFVSTGDVMGQRRLALDSKWVQFELEGQYILSQLPRDLLDWLDQEFPISTIIFPEDSTLFALDSVAGNTVVNTDIRASLRILEHPPLMNIFLPDLHKLDRVDLDLEFNQAANQWNLKTDVSEIVYAAYQIDSLTLLSGFDEGKLTNRLSATSFQMGENTVIYEPKLEAILKEDSLRMEFRSSESADSVFWRIGGALTTREEAIYFQINPGIRINGEDWNVNPDNQLVYSAENDWQINQLGLTKGNGAVVLNGAGSASDSSSIVDVQFKQFEIAALAPFLDLPAGYMSGVLQGKLTARDLQTNLNYVADLKLNNWIMDSVRIGDLRMYAEQDSRQPIILLEAELQGLVNQLNVGGTYDITQKQFDVTADIGRMEMQAVDPFLPGLIHDSNGYLSGQFSLKGSPDQPALIGELNLHQLQTTIDYLNARYQVKDGSIAFTERKIDFGQIRMWDENSQPATLTGVINHQNFSDLVFDLRFQTDRFQFLNTTSKDNALFYGSLILDSDTEIQGPFEQPRFFVHAKTETGTKFYVVPLSDEQVLAQDDFIIYGAPAIDSLGRDTSQVRMLSNKSGVDLKLNLEMTPEAALEIIMDPISGDKLQCKGTSNLAVDMDPEGNVSVVGNYQITEGKYSFSYEQLLKREFKILPNSSISFNGDPLQARLNITSAYELRVPLSDLVEGQLIDESISLTGQRADVQLRMMINGDLSAPVLSFDIILLGNPQGQVADAARTRLQQLRNNETELNTQVFGLLLFNSFISPSGGGELSVSSAGESALLSSLSKLVSNELNRLASGLLKGVDIRLGIEAYKPGVDGPVGDGITTEVQVGVSKRLWNDRLNVTVGGNINVNNTGQEQQALTALTGDFALEYMLTPDGNYLLRVYQRTDYDALYEGNVNRAGAGISIRKSLPNKEKKRKE